MQITRVVTTRLNHFRGTRYSLLMDWFLGFLLFSVRGADELKAQRTFPQLGCLLLYITCLERKEVGIVLEEKGKMNKYY